VGGGRESCCFWWKIPWCQKGNVRLRFRDATDTFFIAKVRGEVFAHFYTVAVKRHSSMRNWLFGLPGRILCEHSPWCKRKWWLCSWLRLGEFALSVCGSCFLPRTLVWSLPGSPSHYFRDLHTIWCCSLVGSIAKSLQVRFTTPNKRTYKISTSTQLREILYTDNKDMLVLPSAVASCYYKCCANGTTSPRNYWYPFI
jgi:hypothetical protein